MRRPLFSHAYHTMRLNTLPPFLLFLLSLHIHTSWGFMMTIPNRQRLLVTMPSVWNRDVVSHQVVADPEMDELKERKEKKKERSWIPTRNGGFLPILRRRKQRQQQQNQANNSSRDIQHVTTIEDYKRVVANERDQMVCVRFFASWCRSCKAIGPSFRKLPLRFPSIKFVEVPLTKDNAFLHKGLGVPSLPFGHLYHPVEGLVEERSLNRKVFGEFVDVLQYYVDESCPLEEDEDADEQSS